MDSTVSVSVHPKAGDGIELRGFESDQGVSGFVALRVPPGVSLWFYTVADLDALIAAAVEARTGWMPTWPGSLRCRCRLAPTRT